jgi:hypothetical protein
VVTVRKSARVILTLLALAGFSLPAASQVGTDQTSGSSTGPWLDDFHQLLSEMSAHYANLDWAVNERHVNLPTLRQQTETKLSEAKSEREARKVISEFLQSFGDGHLEIKWSGSGNATPASARPSDVCERLGYTAHALQGVDFSVLSSFKQLQTEESKVFPAGLLRLDNSTIVGVLRIGLFTEHAFPGACEQARQKLNIAQDAQCDTACSRRLGDATANLLTATLAKLEQTLRQAGATALLVDVTHNGGGSDWVEAPPRALSPVSLEESRFGFIRHEHWTKQLQERLQDVETDIKNNKGPADVLQDAAKKLQSGIEESSRPCNRADVWQTGKINCSLVVDNLLFTSGILAYAEPGSFNSLESRQTLFHPGRYEYQQEPDRLPLYVVVDRDTWSAAEYFVALLQDNQAAIILGEITGGAGCGYTNGGIPTKLRNSGAEVNMPDCVRFRADGSNEVNGITPDVLVPWADRDSSYQRARKLQLALQARRTGL